ncbi:MAG: fasciclin domain-containing protein [Chloroflexi bacterium]|nr:fasciclin domain-containing protein [Chloroflexota bacterium]
MRKVLSFLLVAVLLLTAVAPTLAQDRPTVGELLSSGDLGSFSTLLAAVEAAGLGDTLAGEGPFTILAPTDEAFAASLEAMGMSPAEALANLDMLQGVLLYHVIPGQYFFRNLTSGPTLETAQGESVTFDLTAGAFTVNGVAISNPDNLVANGIVHVIDGVLLPPSMAAEATPEATEAPAEATAEATEVAAAPARPSIAELGSAGEIESVTTLLAAAEAAGLTENLMSDGPFTLFAPTDDAFAALLDEADLSAEDVLAQPNLLRDILRYHIVPGQYFFRNLTSDPTLATALEGQSVNVVQQGNSFTVNDANITDVDNVASNGVVFVIDSVLLTDAQAAALAPTGAHLRVAHFAPDARAVDVYVNGDLKLEGVTFAAISAWMDVRPGSYSFEVVPTGTEPTGTGVSADVAEGDWITVAASGTLARESVKINVLREDFSTLAENRVRLSFFHGIENAGAVDIYVNGALLVGALGYPGDFGDNDGFDIREVGAGTYDVQVRLAGSDAVVIDLPGSTFQPGQNYLLAAVGTPGLPSLAGAATPVQ